MSAAPEQSNKDLSLIIPAFNEAESIKPVLDEALQALASLQLTYELIVVDDGSSDTTPQILRSMQALNPTVMRIITLQKNSGQSAAFGLGFKHCRGAIVVLMDGDGQNDPRDIGALLEGIKNVDACCGYRAVRKDTIYKRWGSRLANRVRKSFIHDGIRDTGCSLKAIRREFLDGIPMVFRGMHRFIPAFIIMQGGRINQIPVNHRLRSAGKSKYTNFGRLKETIWDLLAVRWMQSRYRKFTIYPSNS